MKVSESLRLFLPSSDEKQQTVDSVRKKRWSLMEGSSWGPFLNATPPCQKLPDGLHFFNSEHQSQVWSRRSISWWSCRSEPNTPVGFHPIQNRFWSIKDVWPSYCWFELKLEDLNYTPTCYLAEANAKTINLWFAKCLLIKLNTWSNKYLVPN